MRQAYQQVEQAQRDLRYWAHNYSQTLAGHPPGQKYSQEVCTYTANAVKHLARARRYVEQALGASRDDAVQGRIDRFAQSLAYLHLEWQALECLIEAADHVALADTAGDSPAGDKELEAAELKLKAARKLSRRRQELAARAPGCGLYWDVTGSGPAKVFKASQIDGWFDLVARRRR